MTAVIINGEKTKLYIYTVPIIVHLYSDTELFIQLYIYIIYSYIIYYIVVDRTNLSQYNDAYYKSFAFFIILYSLFLISYSIVQSGISVIHTQIIIVHLESILDLFYI